MIMPLNLLRQQGRSRTVQDRHPVYQLLRWRPNAFQTPAQWKRQMMCHALLWGNARSYIRKENGVPVELIPLMPDRTITELRDGVKVHATIIDRDSRLSIYEDMGQNPEKTLVFPDSSVWHVPGLGFDGVEGKSLIRIAEQSWGIGLDQQNQVASQQKKGYAGGLMLEAPLGAFRNEGDAKEFLKSFRELHEGSDNSGKIGMLREGIKANVLSMSNQDAQFIEQRRFQREDAALLFLLEGILGDSSNASFASLEQRNLSYRQNCLAPWTTAWEEESELKLLNDSERNRGYYFKFNDGALLRTEKAITMAFGSQGIAARVLSPNEVRELFDLNPYDGGDTYENPAITPGSASDSEDQPDPTDNSPDMAQPTNRAMELMIRNLLSVEAKRINDFAKNSANFIEKSEAWLRNWERKLADDIETLGGDRKIATEHCLETRNRILAACECQPEELQAKIAQATASWTNRVYHLIEEIAKCLK
jgi:HK97 family phage portal protein